MTTHRVAAVQFQHAPGDKDANLRTISEFVQQAATTSVELVVFPECCVSGYWHLRHLSRSQLTELAEAVRRRFPELPVLFATGYAENSPAYERLVEVGALMLSKPYRKETLSQSIAAALAQRDLV